MTRSTVLLTVIMISVGCTSEEPAGAKSLTVLQDRLLAAAASGDEASAARFYLDAGAYIAACPARFADDDTERADFVRRHANGRRRFMRFFADCRGKLAGGVDVLMRTGGRKRRQARGCGEHVWEYYDVALEVGGARQAVTIDGIVGIGGRYFVVERLLCR